MIGGQGSAGRNLYALHVAISAEAGSSSSTSRRVSGERSITRRKIYADCDVGWRGSFSPVEVFKIDFQHTRGNKYRTAPHMGKHECLMSR